MGFSPVAEFTLASALRHRANRSDRMPFLWRDESDLLFPALFGNRRLMCRKVVTPAEAYKAIRQIPQLAIEVVAQAEAGHRHAPAAHRHAFGAQEPALLSKPATALRQRDASVRAQHAVPGKIVTVRQLRQRATDEAGASRQAGARGDFPIAGDAAARDGGDGSVDAPTAVVDRAVLRAERAPFAAGVDHGDSSGGRAAFERRCAPGAQRPCGAWYQLMW